MGRINAGFPLIDLHRHLDGSVRLETILDLGRQHHLPLPAWDVESLRPHVQVMVPQADVMEFIRKFYWMTQILVDEDACQRVAFENIQDAQREGIDYLELRFSPCFMAEAHQLDPYRVVQAVCEGVEAGVREFGVRAKLIGIISRTYGPEIGKEELEVLLSQRERLVGLDLAGDEARYPAEMFREHFEIARDAGWKVTVHAGESAGPESIWAAIRTLGANRIGHAVTALQDPSLIDYMKENRIGIECNLTSNVQTSTVRGYAMHPLKEFLDRGLYATINTDDPGISGIDLKYEYEVAAPAAGLSQEMIWQAQRNSLDVAFLTDQEKAELIDRKTISRNHDAE